jgi:hypothetical protein
MEKQDSHQRKERSNKREAEVCAGGLDLNWAHLLVLISRAQQDQMTAARLPHADDEGEAEERPLSQQIPRADAPALPSDPRSPPSACSNPRAVRLHQRIRRGIPPPPESSGNSPSPPVNNQANMSLARSPECAVRHNAVVVSHLSALSPPWICTSHRARSPAARGRGDAKSPKPERWRERLARYLHQQIPRGSPLSPESPRKFASAACQKSSENVKRELAGTEIRRNTYLT